MSTDNTTSEWRDETSKLVRAIAGAVRLMAVTLTSGLKWQVLGHTLLGGEPELRDADVFSGVGFYSRHKVGHKAQAIVVYPGGAANPVIIATRDEDARAAIANLSEDESAMFNSAVIIVCKADGTVEIRTAGGVALALPTLHDFNAFIATFTAHTHVVGGVTSAVPSAVPAIPTGTTVLKAQ